MKRFLIAVISIALLGGRAGLIGAYAAEESAAELATAPSLIAASYENRAVVVERGNFTSNAARLTMSGTMLYGRTAEGADSFSIFEDKDGVHFSFLLNGTRIAEYHFLPVSRPGNDHCLSCEHGRWVLEKIDVHIAEAGPTKMTRKYVLTLDANGDLRAEVTTTFIVKTFFFFSTTDSSRSVLLFHRVSEASRTNDV